MRAAECNDRRVDGKPVTCLHNPEVLREREFSATPAATSRRVTVIGAGPGGLKAAQSALAKGHSVRILESSGEPGGRLRWVRSTAAKRLFLVVNWLVDELRVGGVEVEYHSPVSVADLPQLDADDFVVATGARAIPARAFASDNPAAVLSIEEALAAEPGTRPVLILDRTGAVEVALTAEFLANQGREVIYATPFERIATNAGYTNRLDLRDLYRRAPNIRVLTDTDVRSYQDGHATLIDPDGLETERLEVSAVVAGVHPIPEDDLLNALRAAGRSVVGVGDVLAPRGVTVAIREAALFAQAL